MERRKLEKAHLLLTQNEKEVEDEITDVRHHNVLSSHERDMHTSLTKDGRSLKPPKSKISSIKVALAIYHTIL